MRGLLLMAVVSTSVVLASAQQPMFRSSVGAVALYASVTDRSGRLVPGLQATDFEVLDNGTPVQLTLFSNEPQPATVALVLDVSDSIITKVPRVRDAAEQFIGALQPQDRVRLGTFGGEIAMSPHLTGDRAVLARLLKEELWPGGPTPLWNALYAGMTSLDGEPGRRVVLSLTDGTNTANLPGWPGSLADVERKAVDDDFMIYAIGMEGSGLERRVVQLAERTGGGHFEVKRDADLAATFAAVAEELRRQYLMGFVPSGTDGKTHTLDVRMKTPGLKGRARRSYLQGPLAPVITAAAGVITPAPASSRTAGSAVMQVSVVGPEGTPLTDLVAEDFRIAEGGQIRHVTLAPAAPARITVLIDGSVGNEEAGALSWSAPDLGRTVVGSPYGPSNIWDGVGGAIDALGAGIGPKGVILISDGRGTGNRLTPSDVVARAWRAGVPVSAIITAAAQEFALGQRTMLLVHPEYLSQTLALDTGGLYEAHDAGSGPEILAARVARFADVLRGSYVLRFDAPADRLEHRVIVTVTRPRATVRAAKAYVPGGSI